MEFHKSIQEIGSCEEEVKALVKGYLLFHPSAVAGNFIDGAFAGALRSDDDIHFIQCNIYILNGAYILDD
jgi:hypothetical protein